MYIYFIQEDNERGRVKIGRTKYLLKRFKAIQTASPSRLKLLGVVYGDAAMERALHERFRKCRVVNEWFECTDELAQYIQQNAVQVNLAKNGQGGEKARVERSGLVDGEPGVSLGISPAGHPLAFYRQSSFPFGRRRR